MRMSLQVKVNQRCVHNEWTTKRKVQSRVKVTPKKQCSKSSSGSTQSRKIVNILASAYSTAKTSDNYIR